MFDYRFPKLFTFNWTHVSYPFCNSCMPVCKKDGYHQSSGQKKIHSLFMPKSFRSRITASLVCLIKLK